MGWLPSASVADATAVLDTFHVVKLGTQGVDEVRRRVQQETPPTSEERATYHTYGRLAEWQRTVTSSMRLSTSFAPVTR